MTCGRVTTSELNGAGGEGAAEGDLTARHVDERPPRDRVVLHNDDVGTHHSFVATLGAVALAAAGAAVTQLGATPSAGSPTAFTTTSTTATTTGTATGAPGLNPIPPAATLRAITIAFVNLTVGYVLVSATRGAGCEIAVEKTDDGGATLGAAVPVAPCSQFTQGLTGSVRLTIDDHGDAFVYGKVLYATHDGGSTWRAVPEPGRVLDVNALGSSVWMFVGQCKTPSC